MTGAEIITDRDPGDEADRRCQAVFDIHQCDKPAGHEGQHESTTILGTNGSHVSMVWSYDFWPEFLA